MFCCLAEEESSQDLPFAAHTGGSLGELLLHQHISLCQLYPSIGKQDVCWLVLVLFKRQLLPSNAWCPRNTPSFPDPSLVPHSYLSSPAPSPSLSSPTAFTQQHTCVDAVVMGGEATSPCSHLQASPHQHLLQALFSQCPRHDFSTK